ncbi:response regulator [Kangiella marina]|uniref:Response regulator n=1 Tax=Kangiella marina TaxID=1079178 RepID=A0ABP8IAR1_9GAMM
MPKNSHDITLLLIEDDDIDAMTIERSFLKQKIANPIVRAKDGLEGLAMLQDGVVKKPYVVLLDLQMPRMDGVEFLGALRSDEKLSDTVVFVLTTSQSQRDIVETYKKNIAGYFVKGQAGEQFLDIVGVLDNYWKIVHLPEG